MMRNSMSKMRKLVIWCGLVNYFWCFGGIVLAMPHHEPSHVLESEQESSSNEGNVGDANHQNNYLPPSTQVVSQEESFEVVDPDPSAAFDVTNNGTTATDVDDINANNPNADLIAAVADTTTTVETAQERVNTTVPTMTIQFVPNELSSPPTENTEQDEMTRESDDAVEEFPLNTITPTIAAPTTSAEVSSSSPPSLPPVQPVIDPISLVPSNDDDNVAFSSPAETAYPATIASIIAPDSSSPSIQLIPPPPTSLSSSPSLPREPEQGELPESPEPDSLQPYNLHDIPISLVSLSGNSGGSTSDMATFSSLASPTDNVPVDFTRYRYHVVTGQLFKIGSTGANICPENMRFFAVPGHPKNGACDCDYYQCSRPLIYSPEKHQCYWAWSQGPCEKGEWFVFDKDLRRRGQCEKNPCASKLNETASLPSFRPISSGSEYIFQNREDQSCYLAGTQGYCEDADERLLIYPGEPIPKCRKFTLCYPLTVPQELQCVYGNKYFVEGGQCQ